MDFFSYYPVDPSSPFYFDSHISFYLAPLCLLGALALAVIFFRDRIRASGRESLILTIATAAALFLEIGQHLCELFLRGAIPLDLCAITFWLAVLLCVTGKRFIYDLLYFWGIGALVSLVFVNNDGAGPDRFHYYQYFGTHGYTLLVILYFTVIRRYRVTFMTLFKAVAILFPLTLAVRALDAAFTAAPWRFNYMFLLRAPDVSTPLEAFGTGWPYYFGFVALAVAVFFLSYLPWGIASGVKKIQKKK